MSFMSNSWHVDSCVTFPSSELLGTWILQIKKKKQQSAQPIWRTYQKLNWYFDELLLQVMMIYCIFIIIDYLSISFGALKRDVSAESVDMMMSFFFFSLRHHFHHIRLIFVDFIFVHCHTINERGIRSFLIEKDCIHLQRINHKL